MLQRTKKCTSCFCTKKTNEFGKRAESYDNLLGTCKDCVSIRAKKHRRTFNGFVNGVFQHQKERSIKRNHPQPSYTQKQLKEWMVLQPNFQQLWSDWEKSGHSKRLTPSCDRNKNYLPYTLSNITLMTWEENNINGNKYTINNSETHGNKAQKNIIAINVKSNKIIKFKSIASATRALNLHQGNISNCCLGNRKTTGGYKFKYA